MFTRPTNQQNLKQLRHRMPVRPLQRMVRLVLIALLATAARLMLAPAVHAQDSGSSYAIASDSAQRAQDSTLDAANRAIARDSTQVEEYQKILAVCKSEKKFEEELKIAQQMLAANPGAPLAYFAVGDAELDNGAPDQALMPLSKALAVEPTFVKVRTVLAEAYTMLRSYDTALRHLDTAISFNPRYAQAHMQKAALLSQLNRDSEAVESYRAAAELLPDSFSPWMKLARGLFKAGRYNDALDALTYATTLNNESSDALYLYAEACAKLGRTADAIQAYESFMLHFPTDRRALDAERSARELEGKK